MAGIDAAPYKLFSFTAGSALAGLAGAIPCPEITGLFYENLTHCIGFVDISLACFGKSLPYLAVLLSLLTISRGARPPASLGKPYYRE